MLVHKKIFFITIYDPFHIPACLSNHFRLCPPKKEITIIDSGEKYPFCSTFKCEYVDNNKYNINFVDTSTPTAATIPWLWFNAMPVTDECPAFGLYRTKIISYKKNTADSWSLKTNKGDVLTACEGSFWIHYEVGRIGVLTKNEAKNYIACNEAGTDICSLYEITP